MQNIISVLFTLTLQGTIFGLFILLIQFVFKKHIPHKFKYYMWILVFLKFIIPVNFESIFSFFNIFGINKAVQNIIINPPSFLPSPTSSVYDIISAMPQEDIAYVSGSTTSAVNVLSYVWIGVFLVLTAFLIHYYYTLKINIYKHRSDFTDDDVFIMAEECFRKTGIKPSTEVVFSAHVKSPFVFGFRKALIAIPGYLAGSVDTEGLKVILLHESMHIKKNHHIIKFIISFINILYWWNPLIWLFASKLNNEMENDCDYSVVNGNFDTDKETYVNTLLSVAGFQKTHFTMSAYFGEQNFKSRIKTILENRTFTKVINITAIIMIILCIVMFFTMPKTSALTAKSYATDNTVATIEYSTDNTVTRNDNIIEEKDYAVFSTEVIVDTPPVPDNIPAIYISQYMDSLMGSYKSSDFYQKYTKDFAAKKTQIVSASELKTLELELTGVILKIEYYRDKDIKIEFMTESQDIMDKYSFEVKEYGSKKIISAKPFLKSYDLEKSPIKDDKILCLYLPENIKNLENFSIEANGGSGYIHGFKCNNFEMQNNMGSYYLYDNNFNYITIDNNMGTLSLECDTSKNLKIDNNMGSIKVDFIEIGELDINNNMGVADINIWKISQNSFISNDSGVLVVSYKDEPDDLSVKLVKNKSEYYEANKWKNFQTETNKYNTTYKFGKGTVELKINSESGSVSLN